MDESVYYLAGPMTGVPFDNIPLFERAAKDLRENHDLTIISPIELDDKSAVSEVLAGRKETLNDVTDTSWGEVLGRDVTLIADGCTGIVFLPGWAESRGARLEAVVGLLCGHDFALYLDGVGLHAIDGATVLAEFYSATL